MREALGPNHKAGTRMDALIVLISIVAALVMLDVTSSLWNPTEA